MTTDRNGLSVLSVEQCLTLLTTHVPRIGRVAFVSEGKPLVLPVNFTFHEGAVLFRTSSGAKLSAAANSDHVAFEVDDINSTWEEGWSVLVQGRAEEVVDPDELKRLESLPLRPWGPGEKHALVRVMPSAISGRRID